MSEELFMNVMHLVVQTKKSRSWSCFMKFQPVHNLIESRAPEKKKNLVIETNCLIFKK